MDANVTMKETKEARLEGECDKEKEKETKEKKEDNTWAKPRTPLREKETKEGKEDGTSWARHRSLINREKEEMINREKEEKMSNREKEEMINREKEKKEDSVVGGGILVTGSVQGSSGKKEEEKRGTERWAEPRGSVSSGLGPGTVLPDKRVRSKDKEKENEEVEITMTWKEEGEKVIEKVRKELGEEREEKVKKKEDRSTPASSSSTPLYGGTYRTGTPVRALTKQHGSSRTSSPGMMMSSPETAPKESRPSITSAGSSSALGGEAHGRKREEATTMDKKSPAATSCKLSTTSTSTEERQKEEKEICMKWKEPRAPSKERDEHQQINKNPRLAVFKKDKVVKEKEKDHNTNPLKEKDEGMSMSNASASKSSSAPNPRPGAVTVIKQNPSTTTTTTTFSVENSKIAKRVDENNKVVKPSSSSVKEEKGMEEKGKKTEGASERKRGHANMLRSFTINVVSTYQRCCSKYNYNGGTEPRRVLTKIKQGVRNNGYDNEEYDYICYVHDMIKNPDGIKYEILERFGHGTFSQVLKCQVHYPDDFQPKPGMLESKPPFVALKIIKNKSAYFQQALVEVRILQLLNERSDQEDNLVRMVDFFVYRQHLVIVFDLLSVNLYEVLRQNQFRGLPFVLIKNLTTQLLHSLVALRKARILHCDLKPENVLLASNRDTKIKLVDFGSACFESHMAYAQYSYIQSRFYRSPEVLLGFPYTMAIDMWSLGCICSELFLGLPIFPGNSEYDLIARIVEVTGLPPDYLLKQGRHSSRFLIRTDPSGVRGGNSSPAPSIPSNSPRSSRPGGSSRPPTRPASAPEWLTKPNDNDPSQKNGTDSSQEVEAEKKLPLESRTDAKQEVDDVVDKNEKDQKESGGREKVPMVAAGLHKSPSWVSTAPTENAGETKTSGSSYRLMTIEEYEAASEKKLRQNKRYHQFKSIDEMVESRQRKTNSPEEAFYKKAFAHFLHGIMNLDPASRWTPSQALTHPFITGGSLEDWVCPPDPIHRVEEPAEWPLRSGNGTQTSGSPVPAVGHLFSAQDPRNPESYRPPINALPDSFFRCRSFRTNYAGAGASSPIVRGTSPLFNSAMHAPRHGADSPASITSGQSEPFKRMNKPRTDLGRTGTPYQWSPFPNYRCSPSSQSPSCINHTNSPANFEYHSTNTPVEFPPRSRGSSPWHLASPASSYQGDMGRVNVAGRSSISESPLSTGPETIALWLSDENDMNLLDGGGLGGLGRQFDAYSNDWGETMSRQGGAMSRHGSGFDSADPHAWGESVSRQGGTTSRYGADSPANSTALGETAAFRHGSWGGPGSRYGADSPANSTAWGEHGARQGNGGHSRYGADSPANSAWGDTGSRHGSAPSCRYGADSPANSTAWGESMPLRTTNRYGVDSPANSSWGDASMNMPPSQRAGAHTTNRYGVESPAIAAIMASGKQPAGTGMGTGCAGAAGGSWTRREEGSNNGSSNMGEHTHRDLDSFRRATGMSPSGPVVPIKGLSPVATSAQARTGNACHKGKKEKKGPDKAQGKK